MKHNETNVQNDIIHIIIVVVVDVVVVVNNNDNDDDDNIFPNLLSWLFIDNTTSFTNS